MAGNAAGFFLFKTSVPSLELLEYLKTREEVRWAAAVFGPYQVVGYVMAPDYPHLARTAEKLRQTPGVVHLDARMVKPIPEDDHLDKMEICGPERSVLLINVDYRKETERAVTLKIRRIPQIVLARAMWGPDDIIAIAQADDHEGMRNLICDQVKVMPAVSGTTTLYCYPATI